MCEKKYEIKSRNQLLIIQRNDTKLFFDCSKTVIDKGRAGKDKNFIK